MPHASHLCGFTHAVCSPCNVFSSLHVQILLLPESLLWFLQVKAIFHSVELRESFTVSLLCGSSHSTICYNYLFICLLTSLVHNNSLMKAHYWWHLTFTLWRFLDCQALPHGMWQILYFGEQGKKEAHVCDTPERK